MNRRDILIILGVLVWVFYGTLVLPKMALIVPNAIKNFEVSMAALDLYMISIVVLSIIIPKFGKWGDKKIFRKKK